jgi:N utilization substance protein B
MNKSEKIIYPKNKFKKYIKDVVSGTIERLEIIDDLINIELKEDLNTKRTELLLLIIIKASIFEFLYKPNTPTNVIINDYLIAADFFIETKQKKYLNAVLDKISNKIRNK